MQRLRLFCVAISLAAVPLAGFAITAAVTADTCNVATRLGDQPAACPTGPGATGAAGTPTTGTAVAPATPAPAPTATTLPVVAANTTQVALAHIPIPPIAGKTGSFDILDIDQQAHLLYVADRTDTGVDIFDIATPTAKYLRTVDVGAGANGLTVAKNVNKLFVANNNSEIAIIDLNPAAATYDTVLVKLNTGGKKRADEMDYDPKEKKLYVANSDDEFVTVIDAVGNTIIKQIAGLGNALEQPRYDAGDGMMYMTGSGGNVVFQFDPTRDTLVKTMDVGVPCNPNGLAINPTTNLALLGCSNKATPQTVIFDLAAGKAVGTFDQAGEGDSAIYDAKANRYFFAASSFYRGGQMAIFSGGNPVTFVTNVPTSTGGHAVAYDETNRVVYLPDLPAAAGIMSFPAPA